ncbi:MAG: DUF861 domain-containing protein [Succinivibrio sp.]|nr:DUF861 domain-containing protein [Succinivibrio sp.]
MKSPFTAIAIAAALALGCALTAGCSDYRPAKNADGTEARLQVLDMNAMEPLSYGPTLAGVDVLDGEPTFKIWKMESNGAVRSGVWQATPGKWHFKNSDKHWEYCIITEGESVITEDGGRSVRFKAGDSFVLRPGFSGTWEAVSTTTKQYVIVE